VDFVVSGFAMSSRNIATTIIGPQGLLRDSLTSLIENHSYRVTGGHARAADMPGPPDDDGPRIVLVTVQSMDLAVSEAARVRATCPRCKIVVLLEHLNTEDLQMLANSQIDGCVPLHVSEGVLIQTLDLVNSDTVRVVVLAERARNPMPDKLPLNDQRGTKTNGNERSHAPKKSSATITTAVAAMAATAALDRGLFDHYRDEIDPVDEFLNGHELNGHDAVGFARGMLVTVDHPPRLSERETQIIDGLVKGHPNKMIARKCGIAEATVKAHVKSILRKIQATNRTQAAVWALGQGYGDSKPHGQ
jgi:two-component system nitrate/nitrite response regulator NarL